MRATTQSEGSTYYLNWEIQKAAEKLLREIMLLKPNETVLITCDTTNDDRVINAICGAAMTMGAYPIVVRYPSTTYAGRMLMIEPTPPVLEAIKAADVWIELDYQLLYTEGWKQAMAAGTRQITAAAMDINMLINVIGRYDHTKIVALGDRMVELWNNAKTIRVTSPAGTDFSFSCEGRKSYQSGTYAAPGTSVMLSGQVNMCPVEDSINGVLVFDGGVFPPEEIGKQVNPVKVTVEKGEIIKIEGDNREAQLFSKWMASWNDPNMYMLAHVSTGFNPGILEPTGRIEEDERQFGCMTIGMGSQSAVYGKGRDAANHTDAMISNPSIYCDGVAMEETGFYVDPVLVGICKELKVPGY